MHRRANRSKTIHIVTGLLLHERATKSSRLFTHFTRMKEIMWSYLMTMMTNLARVTKETKDGVPVSLQSDMLQ